MTAQAVRDAVDELTRWLPAAQALTTQPDVGGTTVRRRCYCCDHAGAAYEAHLDWDTTPVVLLCHACAAWERAAGSVIWIRTLSRHG